MWDSSWCPCSLTCRPATPAGMECDFTHLPYIILYSGKVKGKHRREDLLYPKAQFEKVFKNAKKGFLRMQTAEMKEDCLIKKKKI